MPSPGFYYWWVDAPIYLRDSFSGFLRAYRWNRLSYHTFDHFSYLCYLLSPAERWTLRTLAPAVPDACHGTDHLALKTQRRISNETGHEFVWAVGPSPRGTRLLRYHLDRHFHA